MMRLASREATKTGLRSLSQAIFGGQYVNEDEESKEGEGLTASNHQL